MRSVMIAVTDTSPCAVAAMRLADPNQLAIRLWNVTSWRGVRILAVNTTGSDLARPNASPTNAPARGEAVNAANMNVRYTSELVMMVTQPNPSWNPNPIPYTQPRYSSSQSSLT